MARRAPRRGSTDFPHCCSSPPPSLKLYRPSLSDRCQKCTPSCIIARSDRRQKIPHRPADYLAQRCKGKYSRSLFRYRGIRNVSKGCPTSQGILIIPFQKWYHKKMQHANMSQLLDIHHVYTGNAYCMISNERAAVPSSQKSGIVQVVINKNCRPRQMHLQLRIEGLQACTRGTSQISSSK